jgi:hypothetical protein
VTWAVPTTSFQRFRSRVEQRGKSARAFCPNRSIRGRSALGPTEVDGSVLKVLDQKGRTCWEKAYSGLTTPGNYGLQS